MAQYKGTRVHYAGLSDFSVRGAARRHFSRQVASSFAGSSDGKMTVQISLRSEHLIYAMNLKKLWELSD
jgi:hypothetical protein